MDGRETGLSERLPRRIRGYDAGATEALVRQISAKQREAERECVVMREQVTRLEAALARCRQRERAVSEALMAASTHATAIEDNARREAEAVLSKARAEAEKRTERVDRIEREREEAERNLAQLRLVQRKVQTGLAEFLSQAVEELRSEQEALDQPTTGADNNVLEEANVEPESVT